MKLLILIFSALSYAQQNKSVLYPYTPEEKLVISESDNKRGCEKNNAVSCTLYALDLANKVKMYEFYKTLQKACKLKDESACTMIEKTDRDGEEFKKKCEAGDAASCHIYGIGLAKMHHDEKKAKTYLKKACELGYSESCPFSK
jgi:TPR repeat protein